MEQINEFFPIVNPHSYAHNGAGYYAEWYTEGGLPVYHFLGVTAQKAVNSIFGVDRLLDGRKPILEDVRHALYEQARRLTHLP